MEISCKCLSIIIILSMVVSGVAVYIISDKTRRTAVSQKLPDVPAIPNLVDLFRREDPFAGLNESYTWSNNKTGLQLTLLNALDDEWHPFYYKAIEMWDSGKPDCLTLRTKRILPDKNCTPERGYLKVCNDDYGQTSWSGINKVVMAGDTGEIFASAARMNDYYFQYLDSDDEQKKISALAGRQYTMCHEIGHGFGLPHSDEDFYNEDQGNCMDYTITPANNQQPDIENYKVLQFLYGKVSRREDDYDSSKGDTSSSSSTMELSAIDSFNSTRTTSRRNESMEASTAYPEIHHGGGRLLRRNRSLNKSQHRENHLLPMENVRDKNSFPFWINKVMDDIDTIYNQDKNSYQTNDDAIISDQSADRSAQRQEKQHRVLLHKHTHGEVHQYDIGYGYVVQVHLLLAQAHNSDHGTNLR